MLTINKFALLLLICIAFLASTCRAIQCYSGVGIANGTTSGLTSKACPTGTNTCKNVTLVGAATIYACGETNAIIECKMDNFQVTILCFCGGDNCNAKVDAKNASVKNGEFSLALLVSAALLISRIGHY